MQKALTMRVPEMVSWSRVVRPAMVTWVLVAFLRIFCPNLAMG